MQVKFQDRREAGRLLALRLKPYHSHPQTIVLGLPRGGVPIAYEIAQSLHLPLNICLVGKLGLPSYPELAMGAIDSSGIRVLNEHVISSYKISASTIDEVTHKKLQDLQQKHQRYGSALPPLQIYDQCIILVDDGIATGSTMQAAIQCLSPQQPQRIIIAVPIIQNSILKMLENSVDKVIAICVTDTLHSISAWYEDFSQVSDETVCSLLQQAYNLKTPDLQV